MITPWPFKGPFFPLAICCGSKSDILFRFPCPPINNDIVPFKSGHYFSIPCLLQHWEGPSFLSSLYSVCDDKLWALMALFIHRIFNVFYLYFQLDWTGLHLLAQSCDASWSPSSCPHLLILTLKMPSLCFLKYSGSHIQDYMVPSPSRLWSEECLFFHSFHANFNMSPLLSPFFQAITGFIVSYPRSS